MTTNTEKLNPRVIIVFFVKNLLETLYILPIWWIGVDIFEKVGNNYLSLLPKEQIILLLDSTGIIYLLVLILCSYYWAWLTYSNFSYILESEGLHIYHGVIFKRDTIIAYHYIEDIQVYVNPFVAHFLGLYNLHIKTKQVENTTGVLHHSREDQLPGLTPDMLSILRNQLITSSHILTVKPRKYFDPSSGAYH